MQTIMSFVVTLVTMLIMMTAIELITPDNSMKRYLKFVLGLILITVMLSPIISLLSKGEEEILNYLSMYQEGNIDISGNTQNEEVEIKREEVFKSNLENNCKRILKEQFEDKDFDVDIECSMSLEEMAYSIQHIIIGVKDKGIEKVKKVVINANTDKSVSAENEDANKYYEIVEYIAKSLEVQEDKIEVYDLE